MPKKVVVSELGKRLRKLRGKLPARQLALKAGLTHSHVYGIEAGHISTVTAVTAGKLAKALGVALTDLLSE